VKSFRIRSRRHRCYERWPGAMRDVSDNFIEALDDSLKNRPYATLAIVAGLGFLFGATWRR
jgi:ElaB/YqjD/DUF883 family membrane-anchored ribosome-binding protein